MSWYNNFNELEGKTLSEIKGGINSEELIFITTDGEQYNMYHSQDCCENVSIDDIVGDLNDLIGTPILQASKDSNSDETEEQSQKIKERGYTPDSFTWTFYNISTIKGHVTIKWYGESNGYYSESVTFCKQDNNKNDN